MSRPAFEKMAVEFANDNREGRIPNSFHEIENNYRRHRQQAVHQSV
jgi:hypothetical protein